MGVLTYELAAGFPPFMGAGEVEMFSLIQVCFRFMMFRRLSSAVFDWKHERRSEFEGLNGLEIRKTTIASSKVGTPLRV